MKSMFLRQLVVLSAICIATSSLRAATATWAGAGASGSSTTWDTSANWNLSTSYNNSGNALDFGSITTNNTVLSASATGTESVALANLYFGDTTTLGTAPNITINGDGTAGNITLAFGNAATIFAGEASTSGGTSPVDTLGSDLVLNLGPVTSNDFIGAYNNYTGFSVSGAITSPSVLLINSQITGTASGSGTFIFSHTGTYDTGNTGAPVVILANNTSTFTGPITAGGSSGGNLLEYTSIGNTTGTASSLGVGTNVITLKNNGFNFIGTTSQTSNQSIVLYNQSTSFELGNYSPDSGVNLTLSGITITSTPNFIRLGANAGDTLTIASAISGTTTALTKDATYSIYYDASGAMQTSTNTGTVMLTGANTFTGGVTLSAGTIGVGASSVSGGTITNGPLGTGTLTLNTGTTFEDNGSAYTLANSVSTNGAITFTSTGSGSLTFDGTSLTSPATFNILGSSTLTVNNTTTIKDAVTGSHSLTTTGSGTLVLAGANTYTGGTTVSGGNLQLMAPSVGSTSSSTGTAAVTVSGGSTTTVSGTGAALAAVTVTNGSHLAPGVNTSGNFGATGTLSLGSTGGLTLTNATLDFDLGTTAAGSNDKISTAALSLGTLAFNLSGTALQTNVAYDLIGDTSETGFNANNITTTFEGPLSGAYTAQYSIAGGTNNDDLEVTFTSAPEPSTWMMMMIGGIALLVIYQRRKNGCS